MATLQLVQCEKCGATNRVDAEKLQAGVAPVCGKCGATLDLSKAASAPPKAAPAAPAAHGGAAASAGPVHFTDANFAAEVEQSAQPVLVDFWATWCPPCRALGPVIDQLSREMAGKVKIGKLNTDESPRTAGRFRIEAIPTMIIFKNGKEVDRLQGLAPKAEIARRLDLAAG